MLRLIISDDGIYGVDSGKKITWFHSQAEAFVFGSHHRNGWLEEEFIKGINECRKWRHDVAEFGVYGTLLYTLETPDGETSYDP